MDNCNKLSYNHQRKTGYDILIQNGRLEEIINLLSIITVDIALKLKPEVHFIINIFTLFVLSTNVF